MTCQASCKHVVLLIKWEKEHIAYCGMSEYASAKGMEPPWWHSARIFCTTDMSENFCILRISVYMWLILLHAHGECMLRCRALVQASCLMNTHHHNVKEAGAADAYKPAAVRLSNKENQLFRQRHS